MRSSKVNEIRTSFALPISQWMVNFVVLSSLHRLWRFSVFPQQVTLYLRSLHFVKSWQDRYVILPWSRQRPTFPVLCIFFSSIQLSQIYFSQITPFRASNNDGSRIMYPDGAEHCLEWRGEQQLPRLALVGGGPKLLRDLFSLALGSSSRPWHPRPCDLRQRSASDLIARSTFCTP